MLRTIASCAGLAAINVTPLRARVGAVATATQRIEPLAIQYREVQDLIPYARNARTHSPAQVAEIAGSIREFGFTNPVLIDPEGGIIAGHGRVLAARQLEMDQIPTICLSGLSETQRRAYRITDNQMALNAGWDPELLRLGELELDGFDLSLTGFDDLQLGELLADRTEGRTDPDDVPAAPEHPATQPGDLWIMGRHRAARQLEMDQIPTICLSAAAHNRPPCASMMERQIERPNPIPPGLVV